MKTKAAILYKLNSSLIVQEIEVPALRQGQVLVRMLASGLCRSQLNEIKGFKGADPYLPHLIGHEGSGVIEAAGPGVSKVKRGDYVVLTWIKARGREASGSQYKSGPQVINAGAIATFSEYAVISENRVVKISKQVPPAEAALLGCAIPTGAGIVLNTLKVDSASSVAVFGIGGIGASAILAAKMKKCRKVIAVDVSKEKLAFAKKLGATHALLSGAHAVSAIKKISGGGVDYAIEASGKQEAMQSAFETVKDGGTAVIAGNLKKGDRILIDPFDLIKGKKIIGTWGGATSPDRDIPRYAKAFLSKQLPLGRLITHRFKLGEINLAVKALESGKAGRVIIEF